MKAVWLLSVLAAAIACSSPERKYPKLEEGGDAGSSGSAGDGGTGGEAGKATPGTGGSSAEGSGGSSGDAAGGSSGVPAIDGEACGGRVCLNGGTCDDETRCVCATGFAGSSCEIEVDECGSNPCENGGTCVDGVGTYECACLAGFEGKNCQVNSDDCTPNPCQNGGTCVDGVDAYTCTCPAGFTGHSCQTNIDDCPAGACQNDGTCVDGVQSYTCSCTPAFTGEDCSLPRFEGLDPQPGAGTPNAVNSDGTVVVGSIAEGPRAYHQAFRWTRSGKYTLLPLPANATAAFSHAVSANGEVIAGEIIVDGEQRAFRWTAATGIILLPDAPDGARPRLATGVSADGSVLVGKAFDSELAPVLFRWTGGVTANLGPVRNPPPLPNFSDFYVMGLSGDGRAIIGYGYSDGKGFRWLNADLSLIESADGAAQVTGVSGDGTVLTGFYRDADFTAHAFTWTLHDGLMEISTPDLTDTAAMAISSDGQIIAGNSDQGPWVWSQSKGAKLLVDWLTEIDLLGDWYDLDVTAMSADGRVVVGTGSNPESEGPVPWIARL